MATFKVIWEVDLDATNPREAAKLALAMQRDPNSIATFFSVYPEDEEDDCFNIDLDEPCAYCGGEGDDPNCVACGEGY